MNYEPKVPRGTKRAKARKDITLWKQARENKRRLLRGELPQKQPTLKSVLATIERQVEE